MIKYNQSFEEEFRIRLSELREQKNVSAREVSLALGQNSSYINRIENGKTFPSMQAFFEICIYFNITPAEFFNYEISCPELYHSIIRNLPGLSYSQLDAVYRIISEFKSS